MNLLWNLLKQVLQALASVLVYIIYRFFRHGIDNMSKPIPMASRIRLDMVVIGSVAVDRLGHRIGKGEGELNS